MNVNVCLTGLDDELKARVGSFIRDNWPYVTVYETTETPPPKQGSDRGVVLTIISNEMAGPQSPTARSKIVILNGNRSTKFYTK